MVYWFFSDKVEKIGGNFFFLDFLSSRTIGWGSRTKSIFFLEPFFQWLGWLRWHKLVRCKLQYLIYMLDKPAYLHELYIHRLVGTDFSMFLVFLRTIEWGSRTKNIYPRPQTSLDDQPEIGFRFWLREVVPLIKGIVMRVSACRGDAWKVDFSKISRPCPCARKTRMCALWSHASADLSCLFQISQSLFSIPVQIQIYIIYRICPAQPRTRVREKKIGKFPFHVLYVWAKYTTWKFSREGRELKI